MNIIEPLEITDAMFGGGTTIAEPDASVGEVAWSNASVAYTVGQEVIRSTTHRVYRCAVAHTSAASPLPENDPTRWVDVGPTNRWAPFDEYTSTPATATASLTFVLTPGFFNALALYGINGTAYSITIKDEPGGTVIFSDSGDLYEPSVGWYEYLFTPLRPLTRLIYNDLPIRPNAELTVTITAGVGVEVGLGMLVLGDFVPLLGAGTFGGTQHGSVAEPISYSYINMAADGTATIVRRHSATNLRARVIVPSSETNYALNQIQRVLDIPVAWIATTDAKYSGLSTFGLGSATVSYEGPEHSVIDLLVKGLI